MAAVRVPFVLRRVYCSAAPDAINVTVPEHVAVGPDALAEALAAA
jgi:hypothetical protein